MYVRTRERNTDLGIGPPIPRDRLGLDLLPSPTRGRSLGSGVTKIRCRRGDAVYVGPLKMKGAAGRVVCPSCAVADRPLSRLRGLLGRRRLAAGEGLLLKPAPSIHT